MLGWSEEELHGKPMHETIHFQDADHHPIPAEACSLLEVRTLGRTLRSSDDTFTRKDGTTFPGGVLLCAFAQRGDHRRRGRGVPGHH